ncbi:MAG: hypothetical protein WBG30_03895 [Psychrilyobacter sp.]|uniref:hypothetical protein n=1 Tax=Psychrilyobacter sp. TaxID=2586924 RepID=UPI003C74E80F
MNYIIFFPIFIIGFIKIIFDIQEYQKRIIFLETISENLGMIVDKKLSIEDRAIAMNFLQLNRSKYYEASFYCPISTYDEVTDKIWGNLSYERKELQRCCYSIFSNTQKSIGEYDNLIENKKKDFYNPFSWIHYFNQLIFTGFFNIFPLKFRKNTKKIKVSFTTLADIATIIGIIITIDQSTKFFSNLYIFITKFF